MVIVLVAVGERRRTGNEECNDGGRNREWELHFSTSLHENEGGA
jgi:hypothetical protein